MFNLQPEALEVIKIAEELDIGVVAYSYVLVVGMIDTSSQESR